jgi:hypothetical protein
VPKDPFINMKILQRVFVVIYLILVVDAFPTAVRLRTVLQQQRPPQRLPILSSSSSSTARHLKITRVGPGGQEVPISSVPQPTEDKNPTNQSTNDTAAAASSDVVVDPSEAFASIEAGGNLVSSSSTTTDDGTATIPNLIFSLVKSIVGAGVLSLPAGIAMFGDAPSAVIPAVILIATIGVLSGYGFALIGRVCSLTGTASYRSAWEESISKESSWIPAVAVTFKAIFAILAYSMILGDTFQSIALSTGYKISKTTVLMVITTVVLLPLCLLKNLGSLAPFSLLGSLGMVYTAGAMAIRYYGKAYAAPGGVFAHDLPRAFRPSFGTHGAAYALSPKASILLGMLSTAYMAHFNAPRFYNTLQNKSVPRFLTVVGTSFGISIALFAVIAALGFLTFGKFYFVKTIFGTLGKTCGQEPSLTVESLLHTRRVKGVPLRVSF